MQFGSNALSNLDSDIFKSLEKEIEIMEQEAMKQVSMGAESDCK